MSNNDSDLQDESTIFSLATSHFSNEKIKTKEFLEASAHLVSVVERFGKTFSPVSNDMSNNIKKIQNKFEEDTKANEFLEEMILKEQNQEEEGVATDALLWLRRALHFLSIFYQLIIEDSYNEHPANDMGAFLKKAYSTALEPYHGWLGTQLFNVLSRFFPNRRHMMFTLAMDKNNCEEIVIKDMKILNQRLSACIQRLIDFYIMYGLEP